MSKCSQLLCPAPALLKSYFMCMDTVLIFFFFFGGGGFLRVYPGTVYQGDQKRAPNPSGSGVTDGYEPPCQW